MSLVIRIQLENLKTLSSDRIKRPRFFRRLKTFQISRMSALLQSAKRLRIKR